MAEKTIDIVTDSQDENHTSNPGRDVATWLTRGVPIAGKSFFAQHTDPKHESVLKWISQANTGKRGIRLGAIPHTEQLPTPEIIVISSKSYPWNLDTPHVEPKIRLIQAKANQVEANESQAIDELMLALDSIEFAVDNMISSLDQNHNLFQGISENLRSARASIENSSKITTD